MTMLDDDQLAFLFARAGEAFDVPASGAADIVARADGAAGAVARRADTESDEDAPSEATDAAGEAPAEPEAAPAGRARRLAATAARHRVLSVAACLLLVLVVAGTVGALTRSGSTPSLSASSAHTGRSHGLAQGSPSPRRRCRPTCRGHPPPSSRQPPRPPPPPTDPTRSSGRVRRR